MQADSSVEWRPDIDALAFVPEGYGGLCMMHRLAFRKLLRFSPSPADCLAHFADHRHAFEAAARAKIARLRLASDANFHLTSRDLARALKNNARDGRDPPVQSNSSI